MQRLSGQQSPVSWIAVTPDGERGIYMHPNINLLITPEHVRQHYAPTIVRALHFHTEVAQMKLATVLEAVETARSAGVKVFFDLIGSI